VWIRRGVHWYGQSHTRVTITDDAGCVCVLDVVYIGTVSPTHVSLSLMMLAVCVLDVVYIGTINPTHVSLSLMMLAMCVLDRRRGVHWYNQSHTRVTVTDDAGCVCIRRG